MTHHSKQTNCRQRRFGNRQIDPGHDLEVVGAVHKRGLRQCRGQTAKEVKHQNNIEHLHRLRQDQRPEGIIDAHSLNHQEAGN